MGRAARPKPARLATKLARIRQALGLTLEVMAERLSRAEGAGAVIHASVSGYELGTREPPLVVLLEYARLVNVYVEALIDDRVDLPADLPAANKTEGVARSSASSTRRLRREQHRASVEQRSEEP